MAVSSSVRRLAKVNQKMRTDAFPRAPQMPASMVKRFPELAQFNEDLQTWVEQLKNCMEPDTTALDQNQGG